MKRFSTSLVVVAGLGLLFGPQRGTHAASVPAGFDYLLTIPTTQFDSPFGPIPLVGVPINPLLYGPTDTIVQRLAPAVFPIEGTFPYPGPPTPGTDVTIPIELVALQLQSTAPVMIGPSFFDVFVTLDTGTPSLGTMTLRHEWSDSGDANPEGTFDSFFDVFVTIDFTPVGPGSPFQLPVNLNLSSNNNYWSHDPSGFLILGPIVEVHPGVGIHTAQPVPVPPIPEASSLALGAFAALMGGGLTLRRRLRPRRA